MINNKKIEEAASAYGTNNGYSIVGPDGRMSLKPELENAFEAGSHWAINEFLKDLWHPANESPREFAEVLAEANIIESIKTYISFKRNDALFKNWNAYSSGANITRWLYIDDLFPKEGD